MANCEFCDGQESLIVQVVDSEFYGKKIIVCKTCLAKKIREGLKKIDFDRLSEISRSSVFVNEVPCKVKEITEDGSRSFFFYPYLLSFELFEHKHPEDEYRSWVHEIYRNWIQFLGVFRNRENKERKEPS